MPRGWKPDCAREARGPRVRCGLGDDPVTSRQSTCLARSPLQRTDVDFRSYASVYTAPPQGPSSSINILKQHPSCSARHRLSCVCRRSSCALRKTWSGPGAAGAAERARRQAYSGASMVLLGGLRGVQHHVDFGAQLTTQNAHPDVSARPA
jgi:hypothetical protein